MMTAFYNPVFFTLTCTTLGLIVGSFLNVVILRLPKMMEQGWRRECCELLDQPLPDEPSLYVGDGIHPSPAGAARLATAVAEKLRHCLRVCEYPGAQ